MNGGWGGSEEGALCTKTTGTDARRGRLGDLLCMLRELHERMERALSHHHSPNEEANDARRETPTKDHQGPRIPP